jgi:uncharacterized membrane protein (DUF2068 family)
MNNPKRLFGLTALASVIYLVASAWAFYSFRRMVEVLKYYGVSEETQLELDNVSWWRSSLILAGSVFLAFSITSLIASYGVFRGKRWGLYLWYWLVACFLTFHVFRAIISYQFDGTPEFVERCFEILVVLMVALITKLLVSTRGSLFSGTPPPPPGEWSDPPVGDT